MVRVYKVSGKKNIFSDMNTNTKIIYANIICFAIFGILILINKNYIDYIAIKPSNILQGKYLWTILTSMFMHAGLFHIFANMFSMFFIGGLVEKIIGSKRYLRFYLFAGIFSAIFFVLVSYFFGGIDNYAVGASGALFGLVGFLMIITPNLPVYIMFIPIPIKMKYAAPGILILLWIISLAGNIPIGNTAHLGGLIVGLVYGFYLRINYKNKTRAIEKYFR
jgi:membrane associated rhomboid family serine protease